MTSKVKNNFSEAHFNITSCFFMISIRMVKENVKIFKKIHFARIRAQNEFSFEKKKESIYGKAIWPRPRLPPQPRPLFAIEAGNFFREIDPEK